MPRCPKCFGGHLKFDFTRELYYCKGFYDDCDKIECEQTFTWD